MSNEVKQDCKCCETCLNRIYVSNNRYMCDKDLSDHRLADSVLKELPDGHVCDRYSPDIANNPSLRETKPNTEISGFMDIFHEIGNTCELPCADGLTCNECDYFTKEDGRFNVDGVCCYYGIYLYDSAKNDACQHFKLTCCDDNSGHVCNTDSTTESTLSDTVRSDNVDKPPLGIKPPYIFASERISDICEAILRLNQESVVVDTDAIRSYASELCAISDYLDACMK